MLRVRGRVWWIRWEKLFQVVDAATLSDASNCPGQRDGMLGIAKGIPS